MAETTWTTEDALAPAKSNTLKFAVGGILIFVAIIYLITNALQGETQLFKTVDEFYAEQSRLTGRDLRVVGWVIGDSIEYTQIDATTSRLEFDIVEDLDNPSQTLHIVALNEPIPDLLQHEAQALVLGQADGNGNFTAHEDGLQLKCPTRYEEVQPETTSN